MWDLPELGTATVAFFNARIAGFMMVLVEDASGAGGLGLIGALARPSRGLGEGGLDLTCPQHRCLLLFTDHCGGPGVVGRVDRDTAWEIERVTGFQGFIRTCHWKISGTLKKRKPRSMPRFPLLMPAVAAMFTRTAAQQYCNDSTLFSLYTELDTPCEALLADVFGEGM